MNFRSLTFVVVLAVLFGTGCSVMKQPLPQAGTPAPSLSLPRGTVLVVTASHLNLRSCPGTDCTIISVLPKGQQVVKLESESGWLKVSVKESQKVGWVGANYVDKDTASATSTPATLQSPPPIKEEWATPKKQTTTPVKEEFAK